MLPHSCSGAAVYILTWGRDALDVKAPVGAQHGEHGLGLATGMEEGAVPLMGPEASDDQDAEGEEARLQAR